MILRRTLPLIVAFIATLTSPAIAQLTNFSLTPFSGEWHFAAPLVRGEVKQVDYYRQQEPVDGQRPYGPNPVASYRFYTAPDGRIERHQGPVNRPNSVVTLDADGRTLSVWHTFVGGGTGGRSPSAPISVTETASYTPAGILESITIVSSDSPGERAFEFKLGEEPNGRISLTYATDRGGRRKARIIKDSAGRIVEYHRGPFINVLKYNEHGDPVSLGTDQAPIEDYQYEYDDKGNWIRRVRFMRVNGQRKQYETETRKIDYGTPPPPPPGVVTARPE